MNIRLRKLTASLASSIAPALVMMAAAVISPVDLAQAQRTTATVLGTVRDSSGAVVPEVAVRVSSQNTGHVYETVTNELGAYVHHNLPVGRYRVSTDKNGFKTSVVDELMLGVDQQARIDFTLQVGEVIETIEVEAVTPLVRSDNADIGQTIENTLITQLPLNGRAYEQLILLSPGTVPRGGSFFSGHSLVAVNGGRSGAVSYRLDGVDNTDQSFETDGVQPSIDAIQEFKLQSMAFTAENGRGFSYVNVVLKSGTNAFHGGLFEFLRNDKLDARNFFDRTAMIAPLKRNQFGGMIGGPILRNKAFFFFNYEGLRQRAGLTFSSTVPTARMRGGDFGEGRPIFDPATYDPVTGARAPFPGNVIPASRIDPAARRLVDQWLPAPNSPGTLRNYNVSPSASSTDDQFHVRTDYYLSPRDTLFLRYSSSRQTGFDPAALVNQGGSYPNHRTQNAVLSYTHVFSANTLNTFIWGVNRILHRAGTQNSDTDVIAQLGLLGLESRLGFPLPNGGVPGISISGYAGMGEPNFRPIRRPQQGWNYKDDFSHIRGSHSFQFGADVRTFFTSATQPTVSRGGYSFTGAYTQNPRGPANTGDAFADLLLGIPAFARRQNPLLPYYNYWNNYHFYAQDAWKATSRLTLTYGVRYEVNTPSVELRGKRSSFDPVLGVYVVAATDSPLPGASIPIFREASPALLAALPGRIVPSRDLPQYPARSLRQTDWNNIAPRLGLAFRPRRGSATVIRAGYGTFYNVMNGNIQSEFITVPFVTEENVFNPVPVPNFGFRDALASPANIPRPGGWSHQLDFREAYIHAWSLNIQHQLAGDLLLDAAYVGSKGTRLERTTPVNVPAPGPGAIQERRQFTYVSSLSRSESNANSTYHALQLKAEKRFSRGLSFLVAYTASKSIDDASGHYDNPYRDPRNFRIEKALSAHDIPQVLRISSVVELPVGRERRFARRAHPLLDALIGGWQVTGIVGFSSGPVFGPGISTDVANIGRPNLPDRVASGKLDNPTVDRWFDVSAFRFPAPFTIGNTGRNILRADGTEAFDLGLFKHFRVREGHRIEFRSEFFNAFNHPVFGRPNSDVQAANAGIVSSASAGRIIQFGLKYLF